MLTGDQALDRLEHVLDLARTAGADAADAVYFGESATNIGVRLGKLEDIGRAEGEEIGLRLFLGARSAQISTSDLTRPALAEAVARAVAMAREATPDPYAGLADRALLAHPPFPELDLFDPAVAGLGGEQLKAMAIETEDAARAVPGITSSEGGSAGAGESVSALATSSGFRGSVRGTSVSASAVVIAGDGDGRQRDYAWHSARFHADLEGLAAIGQRAGIRTVQRLNPRSVPSGTLPVVFDPRVSAGLIGHLLGAINGAAIARKTSFLLADEGRQIFRAGIVVRDEPHLARGLRSRAFDGEGLPTKASRLIDDGHLTGWMLASAAARQLGRQPTGHASRGSNGNPGVSASNLWLEAGALSPAELMADIADGLYVTELVGMGVNLLTGDYSRGASGFRIRNGELAESISEATVAGNLRQMFAQMVPASDLELRHAMNAPTVRIDGMTVAGQ